MDREPTLADGFGQWSHKIWASDCASYRYTTAAMRERCVRTATDGYTLSATPELKWVMDQQPDIPRAEGRVTTVLTTHNVSSVDREYVQSQDNKLKQALFAKECPADGCVKMPVGWVDAAPNSGRKWSNASSWSCGRLSNASTIDTCVIRVGAEGLFSVGKYDVIPQTVSFHVPRQNDDVIIAFPDRVELDVEVR